MLTLPTDRSLKKVLLFDKTINPENNRPYSINIIMNAMTSHGISVDIRKNAKPQALEIIRKLKEIMPITRNSMYLKVSFPSLACKQIIRAIAILPGIVTDTMKLQQSPSSSSSTLQDNMIENKKSTEEENILISIK